MSDAIAKMREYSQEAMKKAKRAHVLNAAAIRRLKSFPLLCRLFNPKFKKLRKRIKRYEIERFNATAVMMHLARSIKFHERRQRRR